MNDYNCAAVDVQLVLLVGCLFLIDMTSSIFKFALHAHEITTRSHHFSHHRSLQQRHKPKKRTLFTRSATVLINGELFDYTITSYRHHPHTYFLYFV